MYHNLQGFKKNDNKQKYKKIKLSKEKDQVCCLDNGIRLLCTLLSTKEWIYYLFVAHPYLSLTSREAKTKSCS